MSSVNSSVVQEQRARKAALSSFVGAVVDWYDFLLYGIVAALILKISFFPVLARTWVPWQLWPPLGSASCFVL